MILIIDNYDSFTYNLYQYVGELCGDVRVVRNDALSVDQAAELKPDHIIISPGPGYPADAGILIETVRKLGPHIPILGVCLGHQGIGEAFGGKVVHAPELLHGKASEIHLLPGYRLFDGLPNKITAARYHSLVVERASLPDILEITAVSADGEIMGLKHREYEVYGIQFHPESILTPEGKTILRNFINIKKAA
ncbi:MAG TPA: aminodeoxychorismate/anthranilate synthase component II [Clostridia bacterium]|nr:aminodeoxychorismate/anthranilate synthase component II [Clostridia bacterium]